jgi:DNA-binding NarL/FixJ family response regulator
MILRALESGVHGYVPKSVGTAELPRALELVLAGIIFVPAFLAELPAEEDAYERPSRSRIDGLASESLTPRQRDVLQLLVRGSSNKEIAIALGLSEGTVKVHLAAVFRALGVNSRSAAAVAGSKLLTTSPDRVL